MTTDLARTARERTRTLLLRIAVAVLIVLLAALSVTTALSAHRPSSHRGLSAGAAGEHLTWVSLAGTRLPVSPTAGPRDLSHGRARGFAPTATGAAYAALHLSLRVTPQVGPDIYRPTLAGQVFGAGTAALRAAVDSYYAQLLVTSPVAYGRPVGAVQATALSYRVDTLDSGRASVRLLMSSLDSYGRPALTTFAVTLRWVDGDWKLRAPAGGDWSPMVVQVYSQSGFTPFPTPGA